MPQPDQTQSLEELAMLLDEAEALLSRYRETQWAAHLHVAAQAIRQPNLEHRIRGLRSLLGVYAGMGSFNDLVLHPPDGPVIHRSEDFPASARLDNDHFARLSREMYHRAGELYVDLRNEAARNRQSAGS